MKSIIGIGYFKSLAVKKKVLVTKPKMAMTTSGE
jgi:hypothetical protein